MNTDEIVKSVMFEVPGGLAVLGMQPVMVEPQRSVRWGRVRHGVPGKRVVFARPQMTIMITRLALHLSRKRSLWVRACEWVIDYLAPRFLLMLERRWVSKAGRSISVGNVRVGGREGWSMVAREGRLISIGHMTFDRLMHDPPELKIPVRVAETIELEIENFGNKPVVVEATWIGVMRA